MTALLATPLEEIRAALRALTAGALAPDLAAPTKAILTDAAGHASAHPNAAKQRLAIGPGVLELARMVTARQIRKEATPYTSAPATDGPGRAAVAELHHPVRVYDAVPGAEEPDAVYDVCAHCSELADRAIGWPCKTAIAVGLAQPSAPAVEVAYSAEAPF